MNVPGILEASGKHLGCIWEASGMHLVSIGGNWDDPGRLWEASGKRLGAPRLSGASWA